MDRLKIIAALLLFASLIGCTPGYFRQESEALAEMVRLSDSIQIERNTDRLLARQAHVCLISADGGTASGGELLRTIQAGFSGYFYAVSVAGESIDYLRAVAELPCPGASFLFYVQPNQTPSCGDNENSAACQNIASQFIFTVVSVGDQSLVDRIQFSINNSFLPTATSERERQQKAFEQLAIALIGGK